MGERVFEEIDNVKGYRMQQYVPSRWRYTCYRGWDHAWGEGGGGSESRQVHANVVMTN